MSCLTRGGLRGFWGTMFQNGQDCPNVFGCEPIERILQDKDVKYSDRFNAFVQEMCGLLGLAKQVLGNHNLERRYAAGCAMDRDFGRPQRWPRGRWDNAELFTFHATQ
eukprot:8390816-Pyramimonas_sp.AAC.1